MRRAGITKYMPVESCGEKNHDAAAEAAPSPEDTRKYTVLEYVPTQIIDSLFKTFLQERNTLCRFNIGPTSQIY